MTQQSGPADLSRRERQIMDVLFASGRATAAEVHAQVPNKPSYSAIRAHLRILEEKGHVRHERDGARYVYVPVVSPRKARQSALRHMVRTFFEGSHEKAVAALISDSRLDAEELDRLADLVEEARRKGEQR